MDSAPLCRSATTIEILLGDSKPLLNPQKSVMFSVALLKSYSSDALSTEAAGRWRVLIDKSESFRLCAEMLYFMCIPFYLHKQIEQIGSVEIL